jgi:16S rRNA (cytosine1402-N4)-methyltransferase
MRFNQDQDFSAWDVVNKYKESELVEIFSTYGEERFSKRIARAIVQNRPINTTLELADLIKNSTPKIKTQIHPATRVFQALRIEVNQELLNFENTLKKVINLADINAIISLLSFHSLEDRLAKRTLKAYSSSCRCDKNQPICNCGGQILELVNKKPIMASEEELKINPPSRSAKLRIARKIK